MRSVENLTHRQRELTPVAFAEYLVSEVRRRTGRHQLAALFVRRDSPYWAIPGVDCWDAERDAWHYDGPHPVIAHPPCGPWGKYWHRCHQDPAAGLFAIEMVERYGGVAENPLSSRLFVCANVLPDAPLLQSRFGHPAHKPTLLYWSTGYLVADESNLGLADKLANVAH
jgi:hypothetical protein